MYEISDYYKPTIDFFFLSKLPLCSIHSVVIGSSPGIQESRNLTLSLHHC